MSTSSEVPLPGTLDCHFAAERLYAVDQTGQSRALTSSGSADSVVSNLEVKSATRGVRAHLDH